ncbi:GGDEF domain-containing protein [Clostridium sp. AM58-1XD]|uniref:sensor domain-containing phosphodiesterase n=1 Tax=Clostridium sp. AM58-1XD TaxID=2292307 RepID=UPI000E468D0D|nr:GGDEF domain-containing protein [Clostridium sp. AM58-1XD]RGZ01758.1 sensor domain-containing phosphodiesterase [Clostridium sp. AM58-1XD]
MRKIITKLGGIFVPIIFCIALIFTALMSLDLTDDLQGNARVINYIGIVRGATQRLIKKELNHDPDDKLIRYLDKILSGLSNGSDELNLIKLDSEEFQASLREMENDWEVIKVQIYNNRKVSSGQLLYELSEDYFELANNTVFIAEEYTERTVQSARKSLVVMNFIFVLMALGCSVFTIYQEKRRKKLIEAEKENIKKSEQLSKRAQELMAPMNEISELMYVSDMDTYELLFVNEAGKKMFQIDDRQPNVKCYKVLQGFEEPCSFCTNKFLKKDETYSWEYTNPIIKKHYLLKDRLIEWDGRAARMEIAFDITEANNEKNELKRRLERDDIRLACVRELYNNRNIESAITKVLKYIGTLFSAERSYVFVFNGNYYSNIAEWCKEGIAPEIDHLQNIPIGDYQVWLDELEKHKKVVINDVEEMKDTFPTGYELLNQQGIRNIIWVPLMKNGKVNGSIGLDNQDLGMAEVAVPFLQTVQYFLSLTMQRNENEKMLFELSQIDRLTSFYNRNRFIQDVSEFKESNASVGAVYLDINGLKEINDSFGHDAGDKLIKECADIVKSKAATKHLYRIGGDEFVIIYIDITEGFFYDNVQILKNAFEKNECQAAIGCKWNEECTHIQDIIKEADELMYEDKKRFYQGHHATSRYRHNNDRLIFLDDPDLLNHKIKNRNFKVYLQPKIEVDTCRMVGAEALIRYQDDNGSMITPDKFISVLEDTFLISKIDYYVFEEVCKNLSIWTKQGNAVYTISSNFSRVTFMDDSFLKRIEAISDKYHIQRKYLEIEITESASFTNLDTLITRIDQIRNSGFRVAMDDFGVESSNLALLSLVKFDVLKIDKGFVKNIVSNRRAQIIIGTMADMCNEMGIQLIAEGIEDEQQLDVLRKYGVKTVQGFLFSKPISISEYEEKYMRESSVWNCR